MVAKKNWKHFKFTPNCPNYDQMDSLEFKLI